MNKPATNSLLQEHRVTISCAMLVMLSASIPVFGCAFLGWSFLGIAIWGVFAGNAAAPRLAGWERYKQKLCILLAAFATGVLIQYCHSLYLRAEGNRLVQQILEIKQRTGAYPAESMLPLDFKHVRTASYMLLDDGPSVTHDSVLNPFDTYRYDFDKREWVFVPD